MYSIKNKINLNDLLNQKLDMEAINLIELKNVYTKHKNLLNNKSLIYSLPDKGEKIRIKINHIEVTKIFKLYLQLNN